MHACRAAARDDASAERDACATPHSGYHCDGVARRFFEGWYFRVTLPLATGAAADDSFAFMFSVEEPLLRGARAGVGAQVMGPQDTYLVQHARNVAPFWAGRHRLALGHAFRRADGAGAGWRPAYACPVIALARGARFCVLALARKNTKARVADSARPVLSP